MDRNYRRVTARFGREKRFGLDPAPATPSRAAQEAELELLKKRLLQERLARVRVPGLKLPLRRAANEAAALAWVSAYPMLVFPVLFEEKTRTALLQAQRQDRVRERSREFLEV